MTLSIHRVLITAATVVLLGLAAIGAAQVAASAGAASAAPPTALTTGQARTGTSTTAESPTDAGALAVELDAILAAEQSAAPDGQLRAGRGELRRLAAWRRLVHATVVVDLPDKGLTTIQLDHGTISAVTAGTLSIARPAARRSRSGWAPRPASGGTARRRPSPT